MMVHGAPAHLIAPPHTLAMGSVFFIFGGFASITAAPSKEDQLSQEQIALSFGLALCLSNPCAHPYKPCFTWGQSSPMQNDWGLFICTGCLGVVPGALKGTYFRQILTHEVFGCPYCVVVVGCVILGPKAPGHQV